MKRKRYVHSMIKPTGECPAPRLRSIACRGFGLALALAAAMSSSARAEEPDVASAQPRSASAKASKPLAPIFRYPLFVRVHGGVGFAQRARPGDGLSLSAVGGVQLMLPANANQSFGVEIDFIQADARRERRYVSAGLFVENRIDWFLLSIGLMAYAPLTKPRPTPIGISTKLGWAPRYHRFVNPFAVVRADWIFDDRIIGVLSADVGISFQLYSRRAKRQAPPS